MKQNDSNHSPVDEDIVMKGQMEKMVDSYDMYMKRITLGREEALRRMTVNLAQVKPGDYVLEIGCATGTLTLEAKRQAGPSGFFVRVATSDWFKRKSKAVQLR